MASYVAATWLADARVEAERVENSPISWQKQHHRRNEQNPLLSSATADIPPFKEHEDPQCQHVQHTK